MKERIGIGIGGVSILAIFVVLSLTALAALSFVTAQADLRLAEKTAAAQEQYYAADAAAEQQVADIIRAASGNAAWEEAIKSDGLNVVRKAGSAEVGFVQKVDENRSILAAIELRLDAQGVPTGEWTRISWQTKAQEPQSKETMNLLK